MTQVIIIANGKPLEGSDCPVDWDVANALTKKWNAENWDNECIRWRFDCGFKLDFDGGMINVTSRFYPPQEFYGAGWDGSVKVYDGFGNDILEKEFKTETIEDLRLQIETFVKSLITKTANFLKESIKPDMYDLQEQDLQNIKEKGVSNNG